MLTLKGVRKTYPGVVALSNFSMSISPGEVVGLVGENGAGKSTLMKVLGGVVAPDVGAIVLDGVAHSALSVAASLSGGIAFVHQELNLFENLDVAANVFIGREPRKGGWLRLVDESKMREMTERLLERVGANFHADASVASLSLAQRQMVEIAKALSIDARIVILDEPTSSLPAAESDKLLDVIAGLKARGIAVIFISHRLHEVERVADRVVVLRDGALAGVLDKGEIDHDRMVKLMIGRDLKAAEAGAAHVAGAVALSAVGVRTGAYPGQAVDLDVHNGEILGLAGLVGSGRTELARVLFGVDKSYGGHVKVGDADVPLQERRRCGRQRHISRAGGPQGRGHSARPADLGKHLSAQSRRACQRLFGVETFGSQDRRGAAPQPRHKGAERRHPHRLAVGRQPAESGARQMAGDEPQGHDFRRADARHRHRRQGGNLSADARASPNPAWPC